MSTKTNSKTDTGANKTKKKYVPLSTQQLLKRLKKTRDDSLIWWSELAEKHMSKGIGAAMDSFIKSQMELIKIEDRIEGKETVQSIRLVFDQHEKGDDDE